VVGYDREISKIWARMPIYSYKCDCGRTEEVIAPVSECNAPRDCACGSPMRRVITGSRIIPDIEAYQVAGPEYGKWITSRRHHREYLKRHGLEEAGNEKKYFMPE